MVEMSTGAAQVPPAGRVAAWTRAPETQTAVALPAGSTARSVVRADRSGAERSTGAVQVPSMRRVAACTVYLFASNLAQVAVTMPAASTATCGTSVSWLLSTDGSTDRSTGAVQAPPSGRVAACTTLLATSRRRQTAVMVPAGSIASCGL